MNMFEIIKRQAQETGVVFIESIFNQLANEDPEFWKCGWIVFHEDTPGNMIPSFWVANMAVAQNIEANYSMQAGTWPAKEIIAGWRFE